MEKTRIQSILEQNKHKGFVRRILNPSLYPELDLGNGVTGTHLMSWGKVDDKYVVFPTILYNEGVGLRQYDPAEALRQVLQTDNYIEFESEREASEFSKDYKKVWD